MVNEIRMNDSMNHLERMTGTEKNLIDPKSMNKTY